MAKKKKTETAQEQMKIDDFLALFQPMKTGKTPDGGVIRLYHPIVIGHFKLKKYKDVDLYNSVFARVTINRFHNVIKFWASGIKRKVKDADGFHDEYHYDDPPKYEIKGLLSPEEIED